jgi:hypothetical protein
MFDGEHDAENTQELWLAAHEEHLRLNGLSERPPFNVWFDAQAGVIRTYLNLFDTASGRVDKAQAAALYALNGRQPIQLVVQRSQRQALLDAVKPASPWRVDPALKAAVESAICDGSVDRKLEAGIHEKKDAAELVLDGHLLGETPAEVNLHELLRIAQTEFKSVKTIDEDDLKQDWPRLRDLLGKAFLNWQMIPSLGTIQSNRKLNNQSTTLPPWRQRFIPVVRDVMERQFGHGAGKGGELASDME